MGGLTEVLVPQDTGGFHQLSPAGAELIRLAERLRLHQPSENSDPNTDFICNTKGNTPKVNGTNVGQGRDTGPLEIVRASESWQFSDEGTENLRLVGDSQRDNPGDQKMFLQRE